ncbi:MAG TPA: hypothetical protein VHR66_09160 [Gemmataceae bacterium]|jgi:hypothetical protein|nr:hypothetical protein [Gemmataceae bacterium]
MVLANVLTFSPPLALSMAFEMGAIVGITIAVVICTAIPLTTGISKGHVTLGIICALITLPVAAFLGCLGGLPVGCGLAALISIIPKVDGPLLSQSEIEAETRRLQGY